MKYFKFISILFLITLISSCEENIVVDYENSNDPKSEKYLPNSPKSLTISSHSENSVKLNWSDMSAGEMGFIIERSNFSTEDFKAIDTVSSDVTSFSDSIIFKANEYYYYRVNAFANVNSSEYTDTAVVIFEFLPPQELSFVPIDDGSIKLNWSNRNDFAQGFRIYSNGALVDSIAISQLNSPSFEFTELNREEIYEFKVEAFTNFNQSELSNKVKIIYSILPSIKRELPTPQYVNKIEFSPITNSLLVSGASSYFNAKLWDTENGVMIKEFNRPDAFTTFFNEGKHIGMTSNYPSNPSPDDIIRIYDLGSDEIIDSLNIACKEIDFSNGYDRIIISSTPNSELIMYDLNTQNILWQKQGELLKRARFSNDNSKIIHIESDGFLTSNDKIVILNSNDGSTIGNIDPAGYHILDFEISNNDKYIVFSSSETGYYSTGNNFEVWDLQTMQQINQIITSKEFGIYAFDFRNDDKILAVGMEDLRFYRTSDYEPIGEVGNIGGNNKINALDFNNDGNLLSVAQEWSPVQIISFNYGWDYYLE